MIKRLSVASVGVAGLSYITNPLSVLVGFVFLVATPVVWGAWVAHSGINKKSAQPNDAE